MALKSETCSSQPVHFRKGILTYSQQVLLFYEYGWSNFHATFKGEFFDCQMMQNSTKINLLHCRIEYFCFAFPRFPNGIIFFSCSIYSSNVQEITVHQIEGV